MYLYEHVRKTCMFAYVYACMRAYVWRSEVNMRLQTSSIVVRVCVCGGVLDIPCTQRLEDDLDALFLSSLPHILKIVFHWTWKFSLQPGNPEMLLPLPSHPPNHKCALWIPFFYECPWDQAHVYTANKLLLTKVSSSRNGQNIFKRKNVLNVVPFIILTQKLKMLIAWAK